MNSTWLKRLGAAGGLLYVLLSFLKNGGGNSPNFHATQQEIVAWANGVHLTRAFWLGPYTGLLGLLFFLVFIAYLWSVLRQAEGQSGWLSALAFGSGVVTIVIKLAAFPVAAAAVARAADGFNPQVLGILWDMDNIAVFITLATQAFLLAAAAIVIIRTKALPAWLGWSAAVFALILLGTLPLAFFNGLPLQLLPLLWVLVASIVLIVYAGKPVLTTQVVTKHRTDVQPAGIE